MDLELNAGIPQHVQYFPDADLSGYSTGKLSDR